MKFPLFIIMILISQMLHGQTYDDLMTDASTKIESQNFKEAYVVFKKAFEQKDKIGKYDYANAAVVAINCNKFETALKWLKGGFELGLGANQEEYNYFKENEVFKPIRDAPDFVELIKLMEEKMVTTQQSAIVEDSIWRETIFANRIEIADQETFLELQIPKGFALYNLDESYGEMPYFVYFPQNEGDSRAITKLVIFLHGGISSKQEFNPFDASVRLETIFDMADSLNFVVLYPIGKKDFGWKNQLRAFDAIQEIVSEFTLRYHTKNKDLYLGGMSEGGTATFWFASRAESPFRAFFTISALPKLPDFASPNENLCPKHLMYSIHAIDDNTYPFDSISSVYNSCKIDCNWHLTTVQSGGHGFPYHEDSRELLLSFFTKILRSPMD